LDVSFLAPEELSRRCRCRRMWCSKEVILSAFAPLRAKFLTTISVNLVGIRKVAGLGLHFPGHDPRPLTLRWWSVWRRRSVVHQVTKFVSSWKLSLCVYLFFVCLVVSPDLGEIVSLRLLNRSVPQVSLVMWTRFVVAQ
jgi:hypothetical protein